MTLSVNEPTDQRFVSELPSYIREDRIAINSIISNLEDITITTLSVPGGTTALDIGIDLTNIWLELVLISGIGTSIIEYIRSGTNGQVKIFIFQDSDIILKDGVSSDGKLYLNHLPALSNYLAQTNDVLALLNIGGDGVSNYGYWKELFRHEAVK